MRTGGRTRFVVAGAGVLVALAGCSLFTNLDDLGSTPVYVRDDAASDGDAGRDVPRDGATSPLDDAEADAGPLPPAKGCARFVDAGFCMDFDGPDPLGDGNWTFIDRDAGYGGIDLVTADAVSAPNAARFATNTPPPSCSYVSAGRRVLGTPKRITVRFSLKPITTGTFFALVTESDASPSYSLLVEMLSMTTVHAFLQKAIPNDSVLVTENAIDLPTSAGVAMNDVTIVEDGVAHVVKLTFGPASLTLTLPNDWAPKDPLLRFGPYCTSSVRKFLFDDIAVWLD